MIPLICRASASGHCEQPPNSRLKRGRFTKPSNAEALDVMSRAARTFFTRILPPVLVFVLAAAALEAYVRIRQLPMYYMPRPTDVLRTLLDTEQRRRLLRSEEHTSELQ